MKAKCDRVEKPSGSACSSPLPIGVFDSGIGGLTVVKEIQRILPHEGILYFGDTARVPYGSKSERLVRQFALQNSRFLVAQGVKAIVIACNTASAVALQTVRDHFPLPVLGVIEPGSKAAVDSTRADRIGVIGTIGTIESQAYQRAIRSFREGVKVFGQACPLFVPLAEEGWLTQQVTRLVAAEYLNSFRPHAIDTLILGCTHYPLLKPVIADIMGPDVTLIDSAEETARELRSLLMEANLMSHPSDQPEQSYFVSDVPRRFRKVAERFLGRSIESVAQVDLETLDMQKGTEP